MKDLSNEELISIIRSFIDASCDSGTGYTNDALRELENRVYRLEASKEYLSRVFDSVAASLMPKDNYQDYFKSFE